MTTVPATSSATNPTASATPATSASTAAATSAATASSATVNYNEFLQLMVAELKNQDPTAPTDPTQFLSQIASFSQVEQQINTNTKLDTLLTSQALSQADSTIGRTVKSADGTTGGVISAVNISATGGLTAVLTDGTTFPLGNGETLS